MRTVSWLEERVQLLRENHYRDVPQGHPIQTRWGTRARYRFGSIAARNGVCIILANQLFTSEQVPVYVVDETLAHELAHYAHGYGSGLPRLYSHPHRGGIIEKELYKRGLGELHEKAEVWRKTEWDAFYLSQCGDLTAQRENKQDAHTQRWSSVIDKQGNRTCADVQARHAHILHALKLPDAPFSVEWLLATSRQAGLSYWYPKDRTVRLHGLVADRRVPLVVLDFELAYWTARLLYGENWNIVSGVLSRAGLDATVEEAIRWRQRAWTAFRKRNAPV